MSMTAYYTLVSKYTHVFSTIIYEREKRGSVDAAPRVVTAALRARSLFSLSSLDRKNDVTSETRHTPVGRKGIRFLFRNPAAEPHTIRALVRVFVGVTQNDLETPSGDPGRVFFSV